MFKPNNKSRTLWHGLALACVIAGSPPPRRAFAGECPADKMKANAREKVDFKPVGVTDVDARLDRPREAARQHQGPRAAVSQADHRARRHRAVAQPRRPAGADLRRSRARSSNTPATAPSRSCTRPARSGRRFRHLALVEEPRHRDRHSLCRRRPQGSRRPSHVTAVTSAARASLPDVTSRGPPVLPRTPRRHISRLPDRQRETAP